MQTRRFFSLFISLLAVTFLTSSARAAPAANRQLWDRVLESGEASALALSPDGSTVYVAGCNGFCGGKMEAVAYSVSTGHLKWSSLFTTTKQSIANDITVSPDGTKVFVTGYARYTFDDYGDYQTIAYDATTGAQLWTARYTVDTNDFACCITVSPDGSQVFVTGESWSDHTYFDFATIAYNATTGAQEWVTRYNGTGGGYDDPTGLGVSPDGTKVFVTGESPGTDLYNDFATVAYDAATGTQLWVSRYNNPNEIGDTSYDLAVSPGGDRVFVTGCEGDFDYCVNSDMVTIAYDTGTGAQLWLTRYAPQTGQAIGKSMGVSPDGSLVFVIGSRYNDPSFAYVTVAYDAGTGSQVWLKSFSGGANPPADPCCLAVSGDGSRLIVTGSTGEAYGTLQSYTTIAYAPESGSQLWSTNFAGSGTYSIPSDVVVTKNGQVAIVTGTILGPDSNYDWATVAFRS